MSMAQGVLACAAHGSSPGITGFSQEPAGKSTQHSLSEADISKVGASSIEDVVRRLRPEWLRVNPTMRQPTAPERAAVYFDDRYLGGLEVLALVQASEAASMEYLTPLVARGRFGVACPCAAGAISIRKRNGR